MIGIDGSAEVFARQKGADDEAIGMLLGRTLTWRPGRTSRGSGRASLLTGFGCGRRPCVAPTAARRRIMFRCRAVPGDARGPRTHHRRWPWSSPARAASTGKACAAKPQSGWPRWHAELGAPSVAVVGSNRLASGRRRASRSPEVVALDRINPRCVDDPALTGSLLRQVTADLVTRHLTSSGVEFEGVTR